MFTKITSYSTDYYHSLCSNPAPYLLQLIRVEMYEIVVSEAKPPKVGQLAQTLQLVYTVVI